MISLSERAPSPPDVSAYRTPPLTDIQAILATVPRGVQLLRADRVYGADHLRHAAALAARAVAEQRARSADVATETLLYAAGERQIGKALAFLGLAVGTTSVAVVAWSPFRPPAQWTRDDAAFAGGPEVLDAFGVSDAERAMLPRERWGDLVIERVALTDVLKS